MLGFVLCMLGKGSTTDLHPQPHELYYFLGRKYVYYSELNIIGKGILFC